MQRKRETMEGDKVLSPYLLQSMETGKSISAIQEFTEDQLKNLPDYFLVEVKVSPSRQVGVFIDADKGASIDTLASIHRSLYKHIEESALFGEGGNFALEVSSPGLDEPLKLRRQYSKNVGREVEVLLTDGMKETGELKEVSEDAISLAVSKGNKKEKQIQIKEIPFNQIKFTKVRVVF